MIQVKSKSRSRGEKIKFASEGNILPGKTCFSFLVFFRRLPRFQQLAKASSEKQNDVLVSPEGTPSGFGFCPCTSAEETSKLLGTSERQKEKDLVHLLVPAEERDRRKDLKLD